MKKKHNPPTNHSNEAYNQLAAFRAPNVTFLVTAAVLLLLVQTSCKKLIEVEAPTTSSNAANVYTDDATAIAVLTGIYAKMGTIVYGSPNLSTGNSSISLLTGLSSDEFTLYSGISNSMYTAYYKNSLNPNSSPISGSEYWSLLYNHIFICNSAIEGLNNTSSLTHSVKQQLLGEAKFLRAFFYFYLINLFGDVPLITITNYKLNERAARSSKNQVYQQIIVDLKEANNLLNREYLNGELQSYQGTPERVRPNQLAAAALLARVYLYIGDYTNAEVQSTQVINYSSLYHLSELNSVFLKNSDESIWQLQPVNYGRNTEDAFTFIIPTTGPSDNNPVYLNRDLLNSFETGDLRKSNWVGHVLVGTDTFYYPYKYKSATQDAPVTEYLTILRLSEQYLIRSEARAKLTKLSDAKLDLDAIRHRAGLKNTEANTQTSLLTAILNERRMELFSEWGHRWLDLKRTGRIDEVMTKITPQKGGNWNTNWQLYPLPLSDIQKDPNITQNPGY